LLTNFCPLFLVTFTLTAVDPAYAQAELSPAQLDTKALLKKAAID